MSGLFFLLLSIACSTLINSIFKVFALRNINKLAAIVVNYFVCFVLGFLLSKDKNIGQHYAEPWFHYCLLLGAFFVVIFFFMAHTTEKLGISVNAVSSKMSVVIPLLLAFVLFDEFFDLILAIGLLFALASIYLVSVKKELKINKHFAIFPLVVFLGSGLIDTSLKLLQNNYASTVSLSAISYSIFLGAFLSGTLVWFVRFSLGKQKVSHRNVIAGICLGIPNYFSILFLLSALESFNTNSAFVFSLNNVGVVLISTAVSVFAFHEKLTIKNKWGLALAVLSIFMISYANG